jgi:hypothetical protein
VNTSRNVAAVDRDHLIAAQAVHRGGPLAKPLGAGRRVPAQAIGRDRRQLAHHGVARRIWVLVGVELDRLARRRLLARHVAVHAGDVGALVTHRALA